MQCILPHLQITSTLHLDVILKLVQGLSQLIYLKGTGFQLRACIPLFQFFDVAFIELRVVLDHLR